MSNSPGKGLLPSGVWRVQGKRNVLYLAGSKHMLSADEIPFPTPYYAAYNDSKELSVEFDGYHSPTKERISTAISEWKRSHRSDFECPPGKCLDDYLDKETIARLRKKYGDAYASVEKFTPLGSIFYAARGTVGSMMDSQIGGLDGVEDYFLEKAHVDHKRVNELDDIPQTLEASNRKRDIEVNVLKARIQELGPDASLEAILSLQKPFYNRFGFLNHLASDIKTMWRRGDLALIERNLKENEKTDPEGYEDLARRNRQWLPRIREALASTHNQMVLVGAFHMAGEDGLVNLLRKEGYRVEQMYGIDQSTFAARAGPVLRHHRPVGGSFNR